MAGWTYDELAKIKAADELELATRMRRNVIRVTLMQVE